MPQLQQSEPYTEMGPLLHNAIGYVEPAEQVWMSLEDAGAFLGAIALTVDDYMTPGQLEAEAYLRAHRAEAIDGIIADDETRANYANSEQGKAYQANVAVSDKTWADNGLIAYIQNEMMIQAMEAAAYEAGSEVDDKLKDKRVKVVLN